MKQKKLMVISDIHAGHVFSLTHPAYQYTAPPDADRHVLKAIAVRAKLWQWFDAALKTAGRPDILLLNGDAIEGKGVRSGGTELVTSDRGEQVKMAAKVIEHIGAGKVFLTYGTPSHVGDQEDHEDNLKTLVGAEKIESEGHYCINGVHIAAKHYIGNSMSPVSRTTAMSSAAVKQALWAMREQQPFANLIIRSHIHRCYGIIEPGSRWQGWTTPALQGLGTKFGARQIDGLPVDFGFLVVEIENANRWSVTPYVAPMALQKADVTMV